MYGLQVKDASGVVDVTITDSLPRLLGSFSTGTSNGSLYVPEFLGRQGFIYLIMATNNNSADQFPLVNIVGGDTIVWSFQGTDYRSSVIVFYGIVG